MERSDSQSQGEFAHDSHTHAQKALRALCWVMHEHTHVQRRPLCTFLPLYKPCGAKPSSLTPMSQTGSSTETRDLTVVIQPVSVPQGHILPMEQPFPKCASLEIPARLPRCILFFERAMN